MFEDWEDLGFRFGPFGVGFMGAGRGVRYARTETSHVLRIRRVTPAVTAVTPDPFYWPRADL